MTESNFMKLESMSTADVRQLLGGRFHELAYNELLYRRGYEPGFRRSVIAGGSYAVKQRTEDCVEPLPFAGGVVPL